MMYAIFVIDGSNYYTDDYNDAVNKLEEICRYTEFAEILKGEPGHWEPITPFDEDTSI